MRERKKPFLSWIGKSIEEIEKEAFNKGLEAGLAKEVAIKCHSIFNDKESQEFVSLVKKMREAQEELDVFEYEHDFFEYEIIMKRKELTSKVIKLESEVDEYLKKMEE